MIEEKLSLDLKELTKINPFKIKKNKSDKDKLYIYRDLIQGYIEDIISKTHEKYNLSNAIGIGDSIKIRSTENFKLKIHAKEGKKEITFITNNYQENIKIHQNLVILQQVVRDFNKNRQVQLFSSEIIPDTKPHNVFNCENNTLQIYTLHNNLDMNYFLAIFNKEPAISDFKEIYYKIIKN